MRAERRHAAKGTSASMALGFLVLLIAATAVAAPSSPARPLTAGRRKGGPKPKVTAKGHRKAGPAVWRVHWSGAGKWGFDASSQSAPDENGNRSFLHYEQGSNFSWNLTFEEQGADVFQTPYPCRQFGIEVCEGQVSGLVDAYGKETISHTIKDYHKPFEDPPEEVNCSSGQTVAIPRNSEDEAAGVGFEAKAHGDVISISLDSSSPVAVAEGKDAEGGCGGLEVNYWEPASDPTVGEPTNTPNNERFFESAVAKVPAKTFATHRTVSIKFGTQPQNSPRCGLGVAPPGTGSCRLSGNWSGMLTFNYDNSD
jgi:hypothetical protein